MAILDEDGFARLLKAPLTEHIFFIFGDDSYLKEVYAERLMKAALPDETLKFFNFHVYEDDAAALDDIFADADTPPVMAERNCFLIKNYPLDSLGEKALKALEEPLKDVPESSVLIFHYPTVDFTGMRRDFPKWAGVIDLFRRCGTAVELSHRTPKKTAQMLVRGAASRGTSIDADTAMYMIDVCGDDLATLLNEFNKLCAFADGQPITKEMVDETVTKSVEASVFDISTMIFSGNADRAFEIVYELLRLKTPIQPIIGALNQSYMTVYRYKVAKAAGRSIADLLTDMGYKPDQGYVFQKITSLASKFSMERVRRSLEILMEADIKSKSTAASPHTLLTEVIAELCAV